MAELGTIEAPKVAGFVTTDSRNTAFKKRIEEDEKELEALIKQRKGEATETEGEAPKAEAKVEPEAETEEKLSAEEQTYKKRYGDLRRHMNELTEKIKELEAAQKEGKITPPKNEADVAAWMKKYPDVAAIVEAIAEKKASEKFSGAEARLKQIDAMSAEAERKKNESEIRAVHKDFDDLRDSDVFHEWAAEQPKWVQDALYENADDP